MPVRTKRWNDPRDEGDGYRVLVCRYRPRGVRSEDEPWDVWCKGLAPSEELHADAYGKRGPAIAWTEYEARFAEEMRGSAGFWLEGLAARVRRGDTVTLLCSSACVDPARCHRTLVKRLVEEAADPPPPPERAARVVRRAR